MFLGTLVTQACLITRNVPIIPSLRDAVKISDSPVLMFVCHLTQTRNVFCNILFQFVSKSEPSVEIDQSNATIRHNNTLTTY